MNTVENLVSELVKIVKESSVETIVRWVSIVHNMFAPGYLYVYMFRYKEFNELAFFKLLLLAFVLSVPVTYSFYVLVGNYLRKMADRQVIDQESLRIRALLGITMLVIALDVIIFVSGIVFS